MIKNKIIKAKLILSLIFCDIVYLDKKELSFETEHEFIMK